uniref:Carbonic anhydrase n=1 Tax=Chromera velia CCMP2878 TaxID=1169474 RepID=A0A0G4HLT7_9ALVE|mmetsp:Transcript_15754/g.31945  ORF Transcript_15754/g.31945 Transcript_15754/m.31945 type:complete len:301 (+) Transcript_15754:108-1010(+)|eukprot:Cvel_28867.t1-p1 / transcript=Cvel_28867.t1 / gene=Cvel_28867 / organism=Chromera_velia_CCMP2878 / gene_product=Carbonic anhydrase 2, putative / transcript_product=Carbonic anhydrase 2, putative / location=Cvel_scaffold3856:3275-5213(-) / protein_length=300 / sequence_SO=supercontig / SO=protein_coding / is_pseudo=false
MQSQVSTPSRTVEIIELSEDNPSNEAGRLADPDTARLKRQNSCALPSQPLSRDPKVFYRPEDPITAIETLRAGNERFVSGDVSAPLRNIEYAKSFAEGQNPFAAFLACADSRVPVEVVFDQGFGDIFVVRLAGNISSPEVVGSLEFGTSVLGAKVLYVLGHTGCGAVTAAANSESEDVPGLVSSLFYPIKPSLREARGDVPCAIEANVKQQVRQLSEVSPIIRTLIRKKKLIVVGGVYNLESGHVKEVIWVDEVLPGPQAEARGTPEGPGRRTLAPSSAATATVSVSVGSPQSTSSTAQE